MTCRPQIHTRLSDQMLTNDQSEYYQARRSRARCCLIVKGTAERHDVPSTKDMCTPRSHSGQPSYETCQHLNEDVLQDLIEDGSYVKHTAWVDNNPKNGCVIKEQIRTHNVILSTNQASFSSEMVFEVVGAQDKDHAVDQVTTLMGINDSKITVTRITIRVSMRIQIDTHSARNIINSNALIKGLVQYNPTGIFRFLNNTDLCYEETVTPDEELLTRTQDMSMILVAAEEFIITNYQHNMEVELFEATCEAVTDEEDTGRKCMTYTYERRSGSCFLFVDYAEEFPSIGHMLVWLSKHNAELGWLAECRQVGRCKSFLDMNRVGRHQHVLDVFPGTPMPCLFVWDESSSQVWTITMRIVKKMLQRTQPVPHYLVCDTDHRFGNSVKLADLRSALAERHGGFFLTVSICHPNGGPVDNESDVRNSELHMFAPEGLVGKVIVSSTERVKFSCELDYLGDVKSNMLLISSTTNKASEILGQHLRSNGVSMPFQLWLSKQRNLAVQDVEIDVSVRKHILEYMTSAANSARKLQQLEYAKFMTDSNPDSSLDYLMQAWREMYGVRGMKDTSNESDTIVAFNNYYQVSRNAQYVACIRTPPKLGFCLLCLLDSERVFDVSDKWIEMALDQMRCQRNLMQLKLPLTTSNTVTTFKQLVHYGELALQICQDVERDWLLNVDIRVAKLHVVKTLHQKLPLQPSNCLVVLDLLKTDVRVTQEDKVVQLSRQDRNRILTTGICSHTKLIQAETKFFVECGPKFITATLLYGTPEEFDDIVWLMEHMSQMTHTPQQMLPLELTPGHLMQQGICVAAQLWQIYSEELGELVGEIVKTCTELNALHVEFAENQVRELLLAAEQELGSAPQRLEAQKQELIKEFMLVQREGRVDTVISEIWSRKESMEQQEHKLTQKKHAAITAPFAMCVDYARKFIDMISTAWLDGEENDNVTAIFHTRLNTPTKELCDLKALATLLGKGYRFTRSPQNWLTIQRPMYHANGYVNWTRTHVCLLDDDAQDITRRQLCHAEFELDRCALEKQQLDSRRQRLEAQKQELIKEFMLVQREGRVDTVISEIWSRKESMEQQEHQLTKEVEQSDLASQTLLAKKTTIAKRLQESINKSLLKESTSRAVATVAGGVMLVDNEVFNPLRQLDKYRLMDDGKDLGPVERVFVENGELWIQWSQGCLSYNHMRQKKRWAIKCNGELITRTLEIGKQIYNTMLEKFGAPERTVCGRFYWNTGERDVYLLNMRTLELQQNYQQGTFLHAPLFGYDPAFYPKRESKHDQRANFILARSLDAVVEHLENKHRQIQVKGAIIPTLSAETFATTDAGVSPNTSFKDVTRPSVGKATNLTSFLRTILASPRGSSESRCQQATIAEAHNPPPSQQKLDKRTQEHQNHILCTCPVLHSFDEVRPLAQKSLRLTHDARERGYLRNAKNDTVGEDVPDFVDALLDRQEC